LANRLLGAPHEARPVYVSQSGGVTTALGNGNHSWDDFSAVEWVWHQSKSIDHVAAPSSARGTAFVPLDGRGTAPAALQVNANNRTGDWSELGTNHGEVTAATLEVQLHYGTSTSSTVSPCTTTPRGLANLCGSRTRATASRGTRGTPERRRRPMWRRWWRTSAE
jgi:hypothetical protein